MKNKGFIVFLTVIISLLCVYYLSFTFVAQGIQQEATDKATDPSGTVNFTEKQRYLDSAWNTPIYSLLGQDYTYQDVKETELNLGLDLQGGMHVTLEVSPVDILKGLSDDNQDPNYLEAINTAEKIIRGTQLNFLDEFYAHYKQLESEKTLAYIFSNTSNRGRINLNSTDEEVLEIIGTEIDGAIDRSFNILRTRIDRFGTSQPNIQKLEGSGRIQIELPGVDNPERVRKLLQGVAKLEFWEVYEINELTPILQSINDIAVKEIGFTSISDTKEQPVDASALENLSTLLSDNNDTTIYSTTDEGTSTSQEVDTALASLDTSQNNQVSPIFSLLQAQYGLVYKIKDTSRINRILQHSSVQSVIPSTVKFLWLVKKIDTQNDLDPVELLELYAIKKSRNGRAPLTG
ncbi:MAG: protein translocase subunit SecDF, partial [Flammeovirgaceae bacterium]|nr:protein translocase subunit SecDF [Flammeovirgaceae bacterium]